MRSRQQIERELEERREMMGRSNELDAKVRPYIQALEWVLEGDASQIGALKISEYNNFDAAVLCARTSGGKLFINEEVGDGGIYSLIRYERVTDS